MLSNWKGLSIVPVPTTVKRLGAFVAIFRNEQSSQLLRFIAGGLDGIKSTPSIEQFQEGTVEAPMLEKLPITATLEPRERIRFS